MCGRYTLHADKEALSSQFGLDFGEVAPRYNLAPTERIRFVFSNASEQRQAGFAR
jgi:putative SOS response-associated peptidase YedK